MEEYIRIKKIIVSKTKRVLLQNTFLPLERGVIAGIYGRTGSGKSTLMRVIAGVKTAYTSGLEISILWEPANLYRDFSNSIGFIEQCPRDNLITRRVNDELFFSLQSTGLSEDECNEKLEHISQLFNIRSLRERSAIELSEGESQKIAIVEALCRDCELLLLDEPTAYLDEQSKQAFVEVLRNLSIQKPNCRIILSSHDAQLLSRVCNSVYEIRNQSIVKIDPHSLQQQNLISTFDKIDMNANKTVLSVRNLSFSYTSRKVLENINLDCKRGERVVIYGQNGVGKSTLLQLIAGLMKRYTGKIEIQSKDIRDLRDIWPEIIYLAMQEPNEQILSETVQEELELNYLFWEQSFDPSMVVGSTPLGNIFREWNISLDDQTFTLSYGQKRVLSLVPIFFKNPKLLLLDEPFSGIDYELRQRLMNILDSLSKEGTTICMTSHEHQVWQISSKVFNL